MIYTIDIKDCVDIWHPHNKNLKRNYICRIPVKNLLGKFNRWREINPRCADINKNKRVINNILDTAINYPDRFCSCNCGFLMFVKDLVFDKNKIMIELEDTKIHGLTDGGHTYEVLTENKELISEDVIITVEFLVGYTKEEKDEILAISQGRNTNTSLAEYSLQNSKGYYDIIKQTLKDRPYASKIAYKENDREFDENGNVLYIKEFSVRDVLVRMGVMVKEWCVRGKKNKIVHPTQFYSNKGTATNYMRIKEKSNLIETKYIHLLPDVLEVYDYICVMIPDWYNKDGGARFGQTTRFSSSDTLKENITGKTLLTGRVPKYINIMPVIPLIILAALRVLLVLDKHDKYMWSCDPYEFLDEYGTEIVNCLYNAIPETKQTSKAYSNRSDYLWDKVYHCVEMCYFRDLATKSNTKNIE